MVWSVIMNLKAKSEAKFKTLTGGLAELHKTFSDNSFTWLYRRVKKQNVTNFPDNSKIVKNGQITRLRRVF